MAEQYEPNVERLSIDPRVDDVADCLKTGRASLGNSPDYQALARQITHAYDTVNRGTPYSVSGFDDIEPGKFREDFLITVLGLNSMTADCVMKNL
jgi:hypothetical protein